MEVNRFVNAHVIEKEGIQYMICKDPFWNQPWSLSCSKNHSNNNNNNNNSSNNNKNNHNNNNNKRKKNDKTKEQ